MTSAHLASGWMAKARTQVSTPADVWLLARMTAWCVTLRLLKHAVPLPRLVLMVRQEPRGIRDTAAEQKVVVLARWTCRFTRWSAQGPCLERALLTYRYLTALGSDPTLVVGLAPAGGEHASLRGHAWVTVDGVAVDDTDESLEGFETAVSFSADGRQF